MQHKLLGILFISLCFLQSCTEKESEEEIAKRAGAVIYQTNCAACHNGTLSEAPKLASLQLLSKEAIINTLRKGVMRNQASALSKEQHEQLAAFIAAGNESGSVNTVIAGKCDEETINETPNAMPLIGNWGMGLQNQRYYDGADLKITAENAPQLKLSWTFAFPNATRARSQPTIVGNTLYTASQYGTVYALDRKTGCIRWTFQADAEVRSALVVGTDENGAASRLYFSDFKATVYTLDLKTKKLLWKRKIDEHPLATITGSLNAFENRLYVPVSSMEIISAYDENYECCTFRGSMVALNADTGEQIWKTYTIAEAAKPNGKTRVGTTKMGPSGAPIWTTPTIDTKRKVLYFGTGENYSRPVSKTSDAIMALSLEDGNILWTQQMYADDVWNGACVYPPYGPNCPEYHGPDADFGAPVILSTSGERDILLAGQKSGDVFALDPDNNGEIIWTALVGRGAIMGGVHWGMASDGQTLYVPINDQNEYSLHKDQPIQPGVHALNISDGKRLWSTLEDNRCGDDEEWQCGPGISAAITATPEVLFAGALDGMLKGYHTKTGREIWSFNTVRNYDAVNGAKAFGGTIDSDGPVVVGNQLFITSGYAKFNERPGNVLLAFEVGTN
ncbi:MAG: PQQ-binding-like beta-propeller repeat protein [Maribacter sp.]|uniref:outer membrane protein assembly factor BamB family protein n=1 Tax=Maribacter sp. TaxID=1897614 RepID=UPI0032972D0B